MRRVVICSGKVYFDLYEEREKRGIDDIYLLRVEQLYPFPLKAMGDLLSRFPAAEIVWCQEEPQNMGAWTFAEPRLYAVLDGLGAARQAGALCRPRRLRRRPRPASCRSTWRSATSSSRKRSAAERPHPTLNATGKTEWPSKSRFRRWANR